MRVTEIDDATDNVGSSQGYRALPVRRIVVHDEASGYDVEAFESAWVASIDDIGAMARGAPIILRIIGGQPPVALYVQGVEVENYEVICEYGWVYFNDATNEFTWTDKAPPENAEWSRPATALEKSLFVLVGGSTKGL